MAALYEFLNRRDTWANWMNNNVVLPDGVLGVITDSPADELWLLMGDGQTHVKDLQIWKLGATTKADVDALKKNPAVTGGDVTFSSIKIVPPASGYTDGYPIRVFASADTTIYSTMLYFMSDHGDQCFNLIRPGLDPNQFPLGVSPGMELHDGYWAVHRVGTDNLPYSVALLCTDNMVMMPSGDWPDGSQLYCGIPAYFYVSNLDFYTHFEGGIKVSVDHAMNVSTTGKTVNRPTTISGEESILVPGTQYFDTDLGKPIWCKAVDANGNATWVDSTGAVV
ncbi:MAG: hypothetical protein ABF904_13765 [Ethanoligenens sp.]